LSYRVAPSASLLELAEAAFDAVAPGVAGGIKAGGRPPADRSGPGLESLGSSLLRLGSRRIGMDDGALQLGHGVDQVVFGLVG
jgi:hypothetical protein